MVIGPINLISYVHVILVSVFINWSFKYYTSLFEATCTVHVQATCTRMLADYHVIIFKFKNNLSFSFYNVAEWKWKTIHWRIQMRCIILTVIYESFLKNECVLLTKNKLFFKFLQLSWRNLSESCFQLLVCGLAYKRFDNPNL